MHGAVIYGKGDVRFETRKDPEILEPTDAVVRTIATCVCGSDLWRYRGINEVPEPTPIGHEYVGVVEGIGEDVRNVKPGDFVVGGFTTSDNTCPVCKKGATANCQNGGFYDGCQAEKIRVAHADDGAVGLCAILAAKQLGADPVIAMSRHPNRQAIAREFGADAVVAERGEEGAQKVRELTEGIGADGVVEAVGTEGARQQAAVCVRPGGMIGAPDISDFRNNVGVWGGIAPVRAYLERLVELVLERKINPGRVFDLELPLSEVAEAYAAMDERRAIKALLWP